MSRSYQLQDVYEFILAAGTPSALPPPWNGGRETDLVQVALSSELLKAAKAKFSSDLLIQAGLVERTPNKRGVRWAEGLAGDMIYVAAVRTSPGGDIDDLLCGARGALRGRPAWEMALADWQVKQAIAALGNLVLVAPSAKDFAVARGLGLPVILLAGLNHVTGDDIELLKRRLESSPEVSEELVGSPEHTVAEVARDCGETQRDQSALAPAVDGISLDTLEEFIDVVHGPVIDDDDDDQLSSEAKKSPVEQGVTIAEPPAPTKPLALVLMNFSLAHLNCQDSPQALAFAEGLRRLNRDHGLPIDDVYIWKPSSEWMARLRAAAEEGNYRHARELVERGVAEDLTPLEPDSAVAGGLGVGSEAASQSTGFLVHMASGDELDQTMRFDALEAAHEASIARPLEAQAAAVLNPLRANQFQIVADLSRIRNALKIRLLDSIAHGGRGREEREARRELVQQYMESSQLNYDYCKDMSCKPQTRHPRRRRR